MKYVLEWKTPAGGSAAENLAGMKRSLEVLSKWTPSWNILQFVERLDASGGFAVGETDDPSALIKDCAIFRPYLELTVYPVIDLQEGGVDALRAGVEFNESH